jgi:DNA/RNA-binding domain of Phe-tRNA-synthetase-like protein
MNEEPMESTLHYDPAILQRFPDLRSGVILAEGLVNGPSPAGLQEAFQEEQRAVLERIGQTALSELPALAAWRKTFRAFGVDPTKYRSSAEALLRRLVKKGDIPGINALVDAGNLVSIRYALPVAAFNTHALQEPVTVLFADGSERYTALDENEDSAIPAGEVIFRDEQKLVIARRWCWRQSLESAATESTSRAILTIEAQHATGVQDVLAAVEDMLALLKTYLSSGAATRISVKLVGFTG